LQSYLISILPMRAENSVRDSQSFNSSSNGNTYFLKPHEVCETSPVLLLMYMSYTLVILCPLFQ
jgi:hypothetical protein